MKHLYISRYYFSVSFFCISTFCYAIELRPISWDLGLKMDITDLSPGQWYYMPDNVENRKHYNQITLLGSYHGKYNLVYESILGIGFDNTNIVISKGSPYRTEVGLQEKVSPIVFGETVKYRFAFPIWRFTFAVLPVVGLQYSYSTVKNGTYYIPDPADNSKNLELPQITSTIVLNTNHLLSLNTGLSLEFIYNNVVGIFSEFVYRYGLYNHYRHDITYQFNNEPERTISIHQRMKSYAVNIGLKFYFRKKADTATTTHSPRYLSSNMRGL